MNSSTYIVKNVLPDMNIQTGKLSISILIGKSNGYDKNLYFDYDPRLYLAKFIDTKLVKYNKNIILNTIQNYINNLNKDNIININEVLCPFCNSVLFKKNLSYYCNNINCNCGRYEETLYNKLLLLYNNENLNFDFVSKYLACVVVNDRHSIDLINTIEKMMLYVNVYDTEKNIKNITISIIKNFINLDVVSLHRLFKLPREYFSNIYEIPCSDILEYYKLMSNNILPKNIYNDGFAEYVKSAFFNNVDFIKDYITFKQNISLQSI